MSSEGIVLIITKVEDPEELDTRFSRFTMPRETQSGGKEPAGADDILDAVHRAIEKRKKSGKPREEEKKQEEAVQEKAQDNRTAAETEEVKVDIQRSFAFSQMDDVLHAAASIGGFYSGDNSLYRMKDGTYVLTLRKSDHTPEEFNKVCNIMSEYGTGRKVTAASEAYVREHEQVVIS
jgi:adapter protein MecA 1/2